MTPEYRLAQIIETIRAIQFGKPVTKGGVTLLLEPWPDLYWPELTNCAGLTHKRTNEEHRLIGAVGKHMIPDRRSDRCLRRRRDTLKTVR
jgi:hypothetical protein